MADVEFTKTERRILNLLSDGVRHTREELRLCLPDEMGTYANVQDHVSALRGKIRRQGLDIDCVTGNHPISYRLVRMLRPASSD